MTMHVIQVDAPLTPARYCEHTFCLALGSTPGALAPMVYGHHFIPTQTNTLVAGYAKAICDIDY